MQKYFWFALLYSLTLSSAFGADKVFQLEPKVIGTVQGAGGRNYIIENLGYPLSSKYVPVYFVSKNAKGEEIAWGMVWSADRHGVLGHNLETGETHWIDTSHTFGPHAHKTELAPHGNDTIYITAGADMHIFKYTISARKLETLQKFSPSVGRYFAQGSSVGPDGKIYLGTYPYAAVIGVDPATDKTFVIPRLSENPAQKYANNPVAGDDNILYVPQGMITPELFSYNPATGRKKQLLSPEQIAKLSSEGAQLPLLYLDKGQVYTMIGKQWFRCSEDKLEAVDRTDSWPDHETRFDANGRYPSREIGTGETATSFGDKVLILKSKDGKTRTVPVDYEPVRQELFRFGEVRNNVLYGSGIFRTALFGLDLKTLRSTDYGIVTTGGVQSYDIADTPNGLLISSYTGGTLDLFNPDAPRKQKVNPKQIAELKPTDRQERIFRLTPVGKHAVYGGTMPVKGLLNGGIIKYDTATESARMLRGVIPNHSIYDLTLLPDGKTLFGCSTIAGGTGAAPTEKTAKIFLWDTEKDEVIWSMEPEKNALLYYEATLTSDGNVLFFGRTTDKYDKNYHWYVFDPRERRIIVSGKIPALFKRQINSNRGPAGALNYFAADGVCYAYDPAKREVRELFRHPSLMISHDMKVLDDGAMYWLDDSRLMRTKLF